MNQENNNLNQNNFNTQGSNGIPNNQPLNNSNDFNYINTQNNDIVNNQATSSSINQASNNFEQNTNNQVANNTEQSLEEKLGLSRQPINNSEQIVPNHQPPIQPINSNNKPTKKSKLPLIIIIVVVLIVAGAIGMLLLNKDKNNNSNTDADSNSDSNSNGQTNNGSTSNDEYITQITIDSSSIMALTNKGNLYVIGKESYDELGLGKDTDYVNKPTKVASNVKYFTINSATFYIDNNNDLYTVGLNMGGGGTKNEFTKISSNIKNVSSYSTCVTMTDLNNKLYGLGGGNNNCGIKKSYSEITYMADDANMIFNHLFLGGYVNSNGELYISNGNSYEKKLDNVIKVSKKANFILTKDDILYTYGDNGIVELETSVIDIDENELFFTKSNGKHYLETPRYAKSDLITYVEGKNYGYLNVEDLKELKYNWNNKFVYLNTNNEYILFDKNGKTNVGNNVDSMEKILDFVKN